MESATGSPSSLVLRAHEEVLGMTKVGQITHLLRAVTVFAAQYENEDGLK